uniref:F-box domain-containing protein n=1 Tax=Oryza punctata TaxID=4537 RepID=A0A0E0MN28_ORYPU
MCLPLPTRLAAARMPQPSQLPWGHHPHAPLAIATAAAIRRTHETTTTTLPAATAAVDHISELVDDVLLHVLSFLPTASDVARTTVLSKRWRHFSTLAPALCFTVGPGCYKDGAMDRARRLIAGVDAYLTRRATAASVDDSSSDIDVLEIRSRSSTSMTTSSHIDAWLRFAERHVKGRFVLEVPAVEEEDDERVLVAELPCSERAEAMILALGCATVTVPAAAAAVFRALTDFELSHVTLAVDDGGGNELHLGRLLSSSSCPRLRRLSLRHITGLASTQPTRSRNSGWYTSPTCCSSMSTHPDSGCSVHHLTSSYSDDSSSAAVRILAPRLDVLSCAPGEAALYVADTMLDIPHLPTVTTLTMTASAWMGRHSIIKFHPSQISCKILSVYVAGQPEDWENQMIPLEHPKNIEIRGFVPFKDDRKRLVRLLFLNSPALERMTVELDSRLVRKSQEAGIEVVFDIPGYGGFWFWS